MISVGISIDVPNLEEGIRFYSRAFGFAKSAQPVPGAAILTNGDSKLCLLEKRAGSRPYPGAQETRRYERQWTPVHLDVHVDDLQAALAAAVEAGATKEQVFENPEHGSAAFCSDPFGHGFCLIEGKS